MRIFSVQQQRQHSFSRRNIVLVFLLATAHLFSLALSFTTSVVHHHPIAAQQPSSQRHRLYAEKAAVDVTGEDLEKLLTEWEQPLVVDAYATWCGPCVLMAPEFEAAASELKGRVRFVKLDADQEEAMAGRLNIMGLPTLLFLDQHKSSDTEDGDEAPKAVLKSRIEGALQKQQIVELCEHHFFDGPKPELPY